MFNNRLQSVSIVAKCLLSTNKEAVCVAVLACHGDSEGMSKKKETGTITLPSTWARCG